VFHANYYVCYYKWSSFPDGENNPFTIKFEKCKLLPSSVFSSAIDVFATRGNVNAEFFNSTKVSNVTTSTNSTVKFSNKTTVDNNNLEVDVESPNSDNVNNINSNNFVDKKDVYNNANNDNIENKKIDLDKIAVDTTFTENNVKKIKFDNNVVDKESTTSVSNSFGSNLVGAFRKSLRLNFKLPVNFDYDEDTVNNSNNSIFDSNISGKAKKESSTANIDSASFVEIVDNNKIDFKSNLGADETNLKEKTTAIINKTIHSAYSSLVAFNSLSHSHATISISEGNNVGRIITCGYWDNSFKIHAIDTLREIGSISNGHVGSITCVHQGYQGSSTIITGGVDGTCRVWICEKPLLAASLTKENFFSDAETGLIIENNTSSVQSTNAASASAAATSNLNENASSIVCINVLYGHKSSIRTINYSYDLDLLLSGSSTGLICMHALRSGKYIRSITHMEGTPVDLVVATSPGYLIAHSWSSLQVSLFWVNGEHLKTITFNDK
jgi:WD40 repeat protein